MLRSSCGTWAVRRAQRPHRLGRVIIAAAFLVAGCGGGARDSGRATADSGTGSAVTTPPPSVPPMVEAIGHHAENAYDVAKAADWARARATTDSLRAAAAALPATGPAAAGDWPALRAQVDSAIQTLDGAVRAKDSRVAALTANRLTALGARLAEPYGPPVPTAVTMLDYYGREIELWAAAPGAAGADSLRATAAAVAAAWRGLRPQVLAHQRASEAAGFDTLVAKLERARTSAEYARLATPILDHVDLLERVFVP
ncbi:MAG: hypothetical protein ACYC3Q_00705 [Gemmatimonadaceae bacterium]